MIIRFFCAVCFTIFCVSISFACSCADPSVREKFRGSSVVFVGEVISFEALEKPTDNFFLDKAVFKVVEQWKGKKQAEISAIVSIDSPGMCGDLDLKVGEKFLIYAPKENNQYAIYRDCGPSIPYKYADKEIKKLDSFWYRLFSDFYPYPKF